MSKLAIVRVRGPVKSSVHVEHTLELLGISKRNWMVVIDDSLRLRGMLLRAQSVITWGIIVDDVVKLLEKCKKGRVYRLNSPRKGYGRKGTKLPFAKGGALGDRGDKINDLLVRMV